MIDHKDLHGGDLEVLVAPAADGVPVHAGGGSIRRAAAAGDLEESVAAAPEGVPVHAGGGSVERATHGG